MKHGVYADDCAGLTAEDISRYYGVHGVERLRKSGHTGAGELDDEDIPDIDMDVDHIIGDDDGDESWQDVEEQLGLDFSDNFLPDMVTPPTNTSPFTDDQLTAFQEAFSEMITHQLVPEGYGMCPNEWEDGEYPSYWIIRSGRRGKQDLNIALPDDIWRPRSELWVQGLYIMQQLSYTWNL